MGDSARGVDVREPFVDGVTYDVVMLCDVYQCGDNPYQELSPEFVKELIHKSKNGTVYVINRVFVGEAGCDAPYMDGDKKVFEQVFYRTEDGMIHSTPDATYSGYASHPSPGWLLERSYQGVDIAPVKTFGPYRITRLALMKAGAQKLGGLIRPQGDIQFRNITVHNKTWHSMWLDSAIRRVRVHTKVLAVLGPKHLSKGPNGQAYDMAMSAVTSAFRHDDLMVALLSRHPEIYTEIVYGTTEAVLYYGREQHSAKLLAMREAVVTSEQDLATARALVAPTWKLANNHWFLRALFGMAGLFVVFQLQMKFIEVYTGPPQDLMWWLAVLIAPLTEEGARYLLPRFTPAIILFESLRNVGMGMNPVPPGFLHMLASRLHEYGPTGSLAALLVHMWWNHCVVSGWGIGMVANVVLVPGVWSYLKGYEIKLGVFTVVMVMIVHTGWSIHLANRHNQLYAQFQAEYAEGRQVMVVEGDWAPIRPGSILPSYVTRIRNVPADFRGELVVFVDRIETSIEDALDLLGSEVGKNVTYPILITDRLMHQPANVAVNLLAALLQRTHRDPFVDNPHSTEDRHSRWGVLGTDFIQMFAVGVKTSVVTEDENVALMGKKGVRLAEALTADYRGDTLYLAKTINLKANETISACKDVDGVLTMKPRAIQNLPAIVHARMGGPARELASELHDRFDGRVWDVYGTPVRIFFASGFDQVKLSEIGQAIADGETVFAMSGDDSVVGWGGVRDEVAGEADQSKFDHTQDDGPMKVFMRPVLEAFGFSEEFIAAAYDACSSGYTARKGRFYARGRAGTQMPTGVTTTTSFNSMSTLCMFLWFMKGRHAGGLAEAGQELGFDVKYFPSNSVHNVTFLKGWFMSSGEKIAWMPLPSCVLKLGKVLNNPVTITTVKDGKRKIRQTPEEAVKQVAWALSQSYGTVTPSYPILGPFVGVLRRLGRPSAVVQSLQESWKPRLSDVTVDRAVALEAIWTRYSISPEEVHDVETLMMRVDSLPAYLEHPVFGKLCAADY
jgi:hypothetical protein